MATCLATDKACKQNNFKKYRYAVSSYVNLESDKTSITLNQNSCSSTIHMVRLYNKILSDTDYDFQPGHSVSFPKCFHEIF